MRSKLFIVAFVHEGGVAIPHHRALTRGVREAYRAALGSSVRASVLWMDMPEGSAFVAGRPSTLSSLMAMVPAGISQAQREALMHGVCDAWMQTTGCSTQEVMIATAEPELVRRYLSLSRARFHPKRRRGLAWRVLRDAALGRVWRGRASTRIALPTRWI